MSSAEADVDTQTEWYVASPEGEREGPLSTSAVRSRAEAGALSPDQLVWREGFAEWTAAGSVRELFPKGAPPTAPSAGKSDAVNQILRRVGTPTFFRNVGRICGGLAILIFMASVVLFLFGFAWFEGAVLFALFWFIGEGVTAILNGQEETRRLLN